MAKLSQEQVEVVKKILDEKGELPGEWRWILFPPEKQECELVYAGKTSREAVLLDTMGVPFQPVRSFNNNGTGWHNKLILGDNLQVMKFLSKDPEVLERVKLVYIDPPFATKQDFHGNQDQKAYEDKVAGAQFVEFLRKRLIFIHKLLAKDGFFVLHLDYRKKHYIKVVLDEIFDESNFRNEIVVSRVKKNIRERERVKKLNEEFDTLLIYSKSDLALLLPPTKKVSRKERWHAFDAAEIRTGMDYELFGHKPPPNRHWMYTKERAEEMIRAGTLRPHPKTGRPEYLIPATTEQLCNNLWTDIVGYSFAWGYPTEKSEALLARIIEMTTEKGDLVLDAFAGSGTTLAVAEKLGRRWIGIDCGKLAIYTIQKRMLNLRKEIGNKGTRLTAKPFTLYNAGHYDFASLKELPWEAWRFFALQLFECKDKPHNIGGLPIDGERKGAPVLVFNWKEKPNEVISEETIDDIHAIVGKEIGQKFYIIAPMMSFDFHQDYIDRDGVRYYALRIPYNIIHELHSRDFRDVLQARGEGWFDDIQESYGFSFMIPPEVEFKAGIEQDETDKSLLYATIKTKVFISRANVSGTERQGGLETLAMLLIDMDYNGKVFDLDLAIFGEQLEAENWVARFDYKKIGDKVMAVWVDHHGNEFKAVIPKQDFLASFSKEMAS